MPLPPKLFGREEYLKKVVQVILDNQSSRLAILGPGGIGKTSLALAAIHDERVKEKFGELRFWIPCEQGKSPSLFLEVFAGSLGLPSTSAGDRKSDVFGKLASFKQLLVFLFDNFETPWNIEGCQSEVGHLLARIASFPTVSIILTMRGEERPMPDRIGWTRLPSLKQLALGPAREAFLATCPEAAEDAKLDQLIEALDCVPLAIVLMARLAEEGESPSGLLKRWKLERTRLLDRAGADRENSIEVSIRICLDRPAIRCDPDAIPLLSVISMLPGGAAEARLPQICPSIPNWRRPLRLLRRAALVYDSLDKTFIRVLSPIQSFIHLHHLPDADRRRDLREAYFKIAGKGRVLSGDPDFLNVVQELRLEETNIEAILLDALDDVCENSESAINASVCFTHYLRWGTPRSDVIINATKIAKRLLCEKQGECLLEYGKILSLQRQNYMARLILEEAHRCFVAFNNQIGAARCLLSLTEPLLALEEADKARQNLEQAQMAYATLGDPVGVAMCSHALAQVSNSQLRYECAQLQLITAIADFTALGSKYMIARCKEVLGHVLLNLKCYDESRSVLEEAISDFIALELRGDKAICQITLGQVFLKLDNMVAARTSLEDARTLFYEERDLRGVASCLKWLGVLFKHLDQYELAVDHLQNSVELFSTFGSSATADLAHSIFELGSVRFKRGLLDEARTLFVDAREAYESMTYAYGVAQCQESLGILLREEGKFDLARSAFKLSKMKFRESGNLVESARSLINFGIISMSEKEYDLAIKDFAEACEVLTNYPSDDTLTISAKKLLEDAKSLLRVEQNRGSHNSMGIQQIPYSQGQRTLSVEATNLGVPHQADLASMFEFSSVGRSDCAMVATVVRHPRR
ncbi:hypothetical protein FRC02_004783 [Tulasnella sp. 418]|nr:hypothetical protein FRC02_004783 [Tulasnella sp. 418]